MDMHEFQEASTDTWFTNTFGTSDSATEGYLQIGDRQFFTYFIPFEVKILIRYVGPILMLIGTVGNILAALVMTKSKDLWKRATSRYIIFLAINDTLMLLFGMTELYFLSMGTMLRNLSDVWCKSVLFIRHFLMMWQGWILVSMNLERITAIAAPFKVKIIFSRKNVVNGLFATTVIVFLIHVTNVQFYVLQTNSYGQVVCQPSLEDERHKIIWYWIDMALISVIPILIITVTSLCIIVMIAMQPKLQSTTDSIKVTPKTFTTLLVTLTYLVLNIPLFIVNPFTAGIFSIHLETPEEKLIFFKWFIILSFMYYLNYVLNFYIYCVSNSKFREELKALVHQKFGSFFTKATMESATTSC